MSAEEKAAAVSAVAEDTQVTVACENHASIVVVEEKAATLSAAANGTQATVSATANGTQATVARED